MKFLRITAFATLVLLAGTALNPCVHAGPYTDDLTRCIVSSTTRADREAFVRWMFCVIAKHPAVTPMATVPEDLRAKANEVTANLLMRLLTESCKEKAAIAISYEGPIALQTSFQVLGQVASNGLFTDPSVAAAMVEFQKYLDEDKLEKSLMLGK